MSAAFQAGVLPGFCSVYPVPVARGRQYCCEAGYLASARFATDAIGVFALTLLNLIVGSSIQIEDQAGTTTLYNGTAAGTSQLINLDAFAPGASLNDLRIKVRKGSASPYYQPFETLATAFVGSQSIYVSQIPDE